MIQARAVFGCPGTGPGRCAGPRSRLSLRFVIPAGPRGACANPTAPGRLGGEPGERGALPPQRAPRTALGCAPVRGASGVGTEAPGDCSLPAVWRGQCTVRGAGERASGVRISSDQRQIERVR